MKGKEEATLYISLKRIHAVRRLKRMLIERAIFFHKFTKSPRSIGSVIPSSVFLAHAVIRPIDWENVRSIVELGAGTGVFTRYIEQFRRPDCTGVIFEQDREMGGRLAQSYPGLYHHCRAEEVYPVVRQLGISEVDCILSGLPFANFPQSLRDRILDGVVDSLKPGGMFIAFQYSQQMKSQLCRRFSRVDISFVPLNIPPAFVYYCYK